MKGDLIWVVNTQHSVQMMCCRTVHLKPYNFVNRCHLNTFNKKMKKYHFSKLLNEDFQGDHGFQFKIHFKRYFASTNSKPSTLVYKFSIIN